MAQATQLDITPDLMNHQRLESVLEDLPQPSGRPRALGGRVSHRHDRALHGYTGGQGFQDGRASDQAAVDQRCAVHRHRRKQPGDGYRSEENVVGDRLVVEQPGFAASEVSGRSEEHTSELQSLAYLVCRLLLEKKKNNNGTDNNLYVDPRKVLLVEYCTSRRVLSEAL